MLQSLVNEEVIIRLKWGQTEYKGRLISVDSYMNIQLSNTEEFIDGKSTGSLGQVLIRLVLSFLRYMKCTGASKFVLIGLCWHRCNNVLWISGAKGAKQEDTKMDG